jgi:cytochrome c oxidase subunit 2
MNKFAHKSTLYFALVTIAAVIALSACGGNDNNNASESPTTPSTSSAPAAGGATKDITVTATNFQFDQTEIKVNKGDTVKLTLKNENGNHGFKIPDYDVNLKNGESATFVADKSGTFDFACSIQCGTGHNEMTGQLIVQ